MADLTAPRQSDANGAAAEQHRLHTIEAAMERLSLGRSTIFDLLGSQKLRSCKVGRRRLIPESAIVEFIRNLEATA